MQDFRRSKESVKKAKSVLRSIRNLGLTGSGGYLVYIVVTATGHFICNNPWIGPACVSVDPVWIGALVWAAPLLGITVAFRKRFRRNAKDDRAAELKVEEEEEY